MKSLVLNIFFVFAAVTHEVIGRDCWWTGCQLNSWAVKGCQQYNRYENGRQPCGGGNKYNCCAGGGGGGRPNPGSGGGGSSVSYDQFRNAVTSNGYPSPSHEQYNNFNKYASSMGKISSKEERAMCLAQLLHESDGLKAKREYACERTNCPYNYRTPGCDSPGKYYYGRGYIQLTWCGNYRAASQAIFGDQRLVNNPDLVATNDAVAWQTAFWYWGANVHNRPGVSQGKFGATTKAINGQLECSRPGNHQAQKRFRIYGKVRQAFGLGGAGDPSGCA